MDGEPTIILDSATFSPTKRFAVMRGFTQQHTENVSSGSSLSSKRGIQAEHEGGGLGWKAIVADMAHAFQSLRAAIAVECGRASAEAANSATTGQWFHAYDPHQVYN